MCAVFAEVCRRSSAAMRILTKKLCACVKSGRVRKFTYVSAYALAKQAGIVCDASGLPPTSFTSVDDTQKTAISSGVAKQPIKNNARTM